MFVFLATTIAIAGVFYEGMRLQWYGIVGIFISSMDFSFIPATIIHLIVDWKSKMLYIHIVSLVAVIIAVAMKLMHVEYPTVALVLWYFYIWFLYGFISIKNWLLK